MSDTLRSRLRASDYIFSGLKTFHELGEAFPSLVDENGERKTFSRFLSDVRSIDDTYNGRYLRTEYNFASASATMAARWESFDSDEARFSLQYRTQKDDKVRPEHAALDGITLPRSDPFWRQYYPPNGWGCRCTVGQVRSSRYPATPHDEAMALGEAAMPPTSPDFFRFNPGREGKTYPDYNPYTVRRCSSCPVAGGKESLSLDFEQGEGLCDVCQFLHRLADKEAKKQIIREEYDQARKITVEWAETHLLKVTTGTGTARRASIKVRESGEDIIVNKQFFNEVFSKVRSGKGEVIRTMELAVQLEKWLPQATKIGVEPGLHHHWNFHIYNSVWDGYNIRCKAKDTDGLILYTMRIDKIKKD